VDRPRFHLAFPVDDLAGARRFYGGILGCPEGRSSDEWVDFDLFGHQIVAHVAPGDARGGSHTTVDGQHVPVRHFGALLDHDRWLAITSRLRDAGVEFVIEPQIRFAGLAGEQHTCFVRDPSGNALEFKSFADDEQIFRS